MNVRVALERMLEDAPISDIEAEIARSLADALDAKDNGQGKASTAKELRAVIAEIVERRGDRTIDAIDELARKRAARQSG